MAENIIVNFEADVSGLKPAIDILEKIGQIDKATADQYRKDTAAVIERNKALEANQKTIQGTAKTVEDLSNKLKATPKNVIDKGALEAADKAMKSITDTTAKQTTSIRALSLEYRKLLAEANAAGGAQTKAGREALKAAGDLQDKIGDLRAASRAFASDTGAFDAVLQGVTAVGSAYQVATGAAQLFGSENEDLQKAFVKLQSIMAITTGLQQIQNALQKESAFSLRILTPLQNAWTTAMGASTGAMRVLRATLVSTGIGALVIGLGLVIEKLMSFSSEADEAAKSQEGLNETVKSGTQILEDYNKQLTEKIGKSEAEKERENIALMQSATVLLNETYAKRKALSEQYANDITFDAKRQEFIFTQERNIYDKRNIDFTVALNRLNELYNQERNLRERITELRKQSQPKQEEELKIKTKRTDDVSLIEQREGSTDEYINWYIETIREAYIAESEMAMDIDAEKRNAIFQQEQKQREEKLKLEIELANAIKNAQLNIAQDLSNTIFTINANQLTASVNSRLASLDEAKEKELSNRRLTEKQKAEINEKYEKEQAKIKNEAAEKQRRAEIAQAIVNGSLAITNILANMVDPTVTQTFKTIAIASAVVSTALQVARIQSQPVPKYAKGTKFVEGAGHETSDSVPALLSRGERVVTARTNKAYKPILDAIHDNVLSPDLLNSLALNLQYTGMGSKSNIITNRIEFDYNKFADVMATRDYKNRQLNKGQQPINVIVQQQPLRGR